MFDVLFDQIESRTLLGPYRRSLLRHCSADRPIVIGAEGSSVENDFLCQSITSWRRHRARDSKRYFIESSRDMLYIVIRRQARSVMLVELCQ